MNRIWINNFTKKIFGGFHFMIEALIFKFLIEPLSQNFQEQSSFCLSKLIKNLC